MDKFEKLIVKNKRVAVLGLQHPGIAIIKALKRGGAIVTGAQVLGDTEREKLFEVLPKEGVRILSREEEGPRLFEQDLLIDTIGSHSFRWELAEAKKRGIRVLSELDFVSYFVKSVLVGITGTNGKSTTAQFLKTILDQAKVSSFVTGGTIPFAEALNHPSDVVICEVNSPRLEASENFKPHVSVLVSLAPSHTERHPTMMQYFLTKAKIYSNQDPEDYLVYHGISDAISEVFRQVPPRAQLFPFNYAEEVSQGVFKQGNEIFFARNGVLSRFSLGDFPLRGAHNVENLMAAVAAAKLLGVDDKAIAAAIPEMPVLENRLQSLGKIEGVEFVNDGRSANPAASSWALHTYKKDIIWIAGGQFMRGLDYRPIKDRIQKHVKMLILFGNDRKKFHQVWEGCAETYLVDSLQTAVHLAYKKSVPGDVVLFSPASPPGLGTHGTAAIRSAEFQKIFENLILQQKERKLLSSELGRI